MMLVQGFKWPFTIKDGRVAKSADIDHLKENIKQIILTRPGEILFKSSWGCGIHRRLFDSTNAARMAETEIKQAIKLFEPRVTVTRVKSDLSEIASGLLKIDVAFKVNGQEIEDQTFVEVRN